MKKKQLRKFISLFGSLADADAVLSGKYDQNRREKLNICAKLKLANAEVNNLVFDGKGKFLKKVTDDVNDNLYKYPLSRVEYIKDLLRSLARTMQVLDKWVYRNVIELSPEDPLYNKDSNNNSLPFQSIHEGENGNSIVTDYVMACSMSLWLFSQKLDKRCLHFDLDLIDIQKEVGIFVYNQRIPGNLVDSGYADKVKWIHEKEAARTKALPNPGLHVEKHVKSFPDWLTHKRPDDLAGICKKIFNKNESPKEYAIMLCLLSQNGCVSIADRQRKPFYEAWYNFINRPLPTNNSYSSINKYIQEKAANGFHFDVNDIDYLNLEKIFINALEKIS